jgi:hypothetical protein
VSISAGIPMRLPIRARPFLPLLVVFATTLAAPAAAEPPPCAFWDGDALHLAGRIDGVDLVLYLATGWPSAHGPDGASGLIMDTARWRAGHDDEGLVALDGQLLDGCRLELETPLERETPLEPQTVPDKVSWSLRFVSATRLEGTRRIDGRSEAIALTVTPPFDCSAGPWTIFDEPRWPVTFEYPLSARLTPDVSLACPDVSRLAWGASPLSIARVPIETSRLDDGRTRTTIGPFFRDGRSPWQVDEKRFAFESDDEACSQERSSRSADREDDRPIRECKAATRVRWRGFTVLYGESSSEARASRPGGGSLGQGSGLSYYAFLVGKAAVLVSSDDLWGRIADVDKPPGRDERSTRRMAARIIRSLKRR